MREGKIVAHERIRKKRKTKKIEAISACVAEGEEMWTALRDSWLQVWHTLPDTKFSSAVPFTRHIRKTMSVFLRIIEIHLETKRSESLSLKVAIFAVFGTFKFFFLSFFPRLLS
jgi:hypothetical protein